MVTHTLAIAEFADLSQQPAYVDTRLGLVDGGGVLPGFTLPVRQIFR